MFVRPKNCTYCEHGYYGLLHVVQYAQSKGLWNITDLSAEQAVKESVYPKIDETDPFGFFGFGHGNNCYSGDTEILTENGWKYFYELNKNEKVATLNKDTGKLEYYIPTRHISYWYKGDMFYQKGRAIDLLVTPDHNLFVSWLCNEGKRYKPFQFIKPSELKNGSKKEENRYTETNLTESRLKFKRDAIWEGTEQEFFILPAIKKKIKNQYGHESDYIVDEKRILMNDWLEFLGYFISEGSACLGFADKNKKYINYRVAIAQNNTKKRDKIKKCIEKMGYSYCESGNSHCMNLEIRDKQLYEYLKQFGHAGDKYIPAEIKKLSKIQLNILFEALILGDGSKYDTRYGYSTKSKRLADDVQEISLKLGYASTILKDKKTEIYILTISTKTGLNPLCRKEHRGYIEYDGIVYCVEVPNHIIYIRRNGKPVWCGNCRYTGDTEQDIFECEECSKLSGRIVYLLSCLTANGLGYKIIENGAIAYAGYNISWTWVSEGEPTGDPYEDKYAHGYWESANELWMAFIDGDDFYTAVQKCMYKYNQWIDYWYNSGDPDAAQVMMWLVHDRDGLVVLDSCSIQYSEQDCLASGCYWVGSKCYSHPPPPPSFGFSIVPLIPIIMLVGLAFIAGQTKPKNIYTD